MFNSFRSSATAALFVASAFALTGCETVAPGLYPALTGGAPAEEEKDYASMDCSQLSAQVANLSSTERRLEAAARMTGGDLGEIRTYYSELRRKVADAQMAAGC